VTSRGQQYAPLRDNGYCNSYVLRGGVAPIRRPRTVGFGALRLLYRCSNWIAETISVGTSSDYRRRISELWSLWPPWNGLNSAITSDTFLYGLPRLFILRLYRGVSIHICRQTGLRSTCAGGIGFRREDVNIGISKSL
jgi:hypothetical protein